jgi:hypothetical protein
MKNEAKTKLPKNVRLAIAEHAEQIAHYLSAADGIMPRPGSAALESPHKRGDIDCIEDARVFGIPALVRWLRGSFPTLRTHRILKGSQDPVRGIEFDKLCRRLRAGGRISPCIYLLDLGKPNERLEVYSGAFMSQLVMASEAQYRNLLTAHSGPPEHFLRINPSMDRVHSFDWPGLDISMPMAGATGDYAGLHIGDVEWRRNYATYDNELLVLFAEIRNIDPQDYLRIDLKQQGLPLGEPSPDYSHIKRLSGVLGLSASS